MDHTRTPITDSKLLTLNAHYRRILSLSKLPGEHLPVPPNKIAAFLVVVAMNIDILEQILP